MEPNETTIVPDVTEMPVTDPAAGDGAAVSPEEAEALPAEASPAKSKPRPAGRARNAALLELAKQVENDRTRDYIENRVVEQMNNYAVQSKRNKLWYTRLMTASIVLSALIPVVSVGSGLSTFLKVVIALLGTSVTGINAYLALQNYQDLWLTYRNIRETLLRILYWYFNNAEMFHDSALTQEDKDVLLVEECERAMSSENRAWAPRMRMRAEKAALESKR